MARRKARGFTVVEVVLAMAIAAMILAALATALISLSSSLRINDRQLRSRQSASAMLNLALAKVRRARQVHCEPASSPDHSYSRIEILDDGVWNKDHYDSPRYTVMEFSDAGIYMGTGDNANALTTTSGMQKVLSNVNGLFRSSPQGGAHRAVTVELTISAPDAFSGASTDFSLTGSAALRSAHD